MSGHSFAKRVFSCQHCHQLRDLQPCPPPVSAVSPASPSFPLLTGLLPAVCTYSHVPTIMGTFFLLSALLLIHQVGRTPGLSGLPLQLGFYG